MGGLGAGIQLGVIPGRTVGAERTGARVQVPDNAVAAPVGRYARSGTRIGIVIRPLRGGRQRKRAVGDRKSFAYVVGIADVAAAHVIDRIIEVGRRVERAADGCVVGFLDDVIGR